MAEDHLKRSASFGSTRPDEQSFEEDPLVELARIVAEDGGFRRQRAPELRPARNEPTRYDSPGREEAIASQLEAELMQSWDELGGELGEPQQPAAEMRPSTHVPLGPSAGGAAGPSQRFPEIVIEDARPARIASGGQHEEWHHRNPAPREEAPEPFEAELSALFPPSDVSPAAEAALGPVEQGGDSIAADDYQDSYGDGYSAEIEEYSYLESEPEPDGNFLEEDAFPEEDTAALVAEERKPARRGRSHKGLIAAAGVLGIVILGGTVAAVVGGVGGDDEGTTPPVIRAEAGPAKVEAEQTADAQAGDGAGQAVYDRVAGRAPKSDEQLVDRTEAPQQVSRIVLPEADARQEPLAGTEPAAADSRPDDAAPGDPIGGQISSETASMQSGPRIDPVGPRRVRTVTVRPDGSIASAPAPVRVAEAASQPAGQLETVFDGADAPDPVPVRTVRIEGDGQGPDRALQSEPPEAGTPSPVEPQPLARLIDNDDPQSAARNGDSGAGQASAGAGQPGAEEASEPTLAAEEQVAMLPRARPDEVPAAFLRPAAARAAEPQQAAREPAAASRGGQPVDLLAAAPAAPRPQAQQPQPTQQAARPASPSGSSPYAVQLSAQRSEDQARATFASLRNQYPSILGSQQPQIERADLGERGIYYRVRVGAGSQAEAVQLCEQLKAAGGSCFVTR